MRRTWIGSGLIFCVLLLFYRRLHSVANTISYVFFVHPDNISDHKRYLRFTAEIEKRLRSLSKLSYKNRSTFIDYGKPVSEYLPPHYPKTKLILDWTGFWDKNKSILPERLTCADLVTCESTMDRKKLLLSDAVFFHGADRGGLKNFPTQRLRYQRWVFFMMESPYQTLTKPEELNGVFNFTVTYRRDSDFQIAYFETFRRPSALTNSQYDELMKDIMKNKTRLMAQMNSHCDAAHTNRLAYVRDLQQYMNVDTYGACGVLDCPRGTKECEDKMKSYKFYMALENSHCREYITEKAGQPLFEWGTVPVVMGGASSKDYEQMLPPGSFIDTSGFESPQELSEYLLLLDRNPDLYERYHQWRRNFTGKVHWSNAFCRLCRNLYDTAAPVQTYRNFSGWYAQDTCKV